MALMIRPSFNIAGADPTDYGELTPNIGPEKLLVDQLKEYGNSDVDTLATDLYRLLSKDKVDEAREIIAQFYEEHYATVTEDVELKTEEPPEDGDVQTTLKED